MSHHPVAAVLVALLGTAGAASAQSQLYFTEYKFEDPTLKAMDFDGSNVADLFDPGNAIPPSDWLTVGLALDESAGKIYWLHGSTPGRIGRADLNGENQQTLVTGLKIPRGLALDLAGGKMYWSASPPAGNAGGMIQRADLDGSNIETVYLDPDYDPSFSKIGRPTVDSVNGWVYFATNDRIVRCNVDGPPFEFLTVVTGVSTARAIALDVAEGHIYWIGADTIEDVVCRANLDNTGFTVVADFSPASGNSNGLSDIALDLAGRTFFVCDDLRDDIDRGALDGSSVATIYTAPAGYSPSAMTLDANVAQPMLDCNDNGILDGEDVLGGGSDDCNHNAIPDECEDDPCVPPDYLLEQSADVANPGRQLGGAPENQRWIVFQPFDVSAGGWEIGEVHLNGVTWTYRPDGFTATILPDDGTDYPDETNPLAAGDAFFRFSPEWVEIPMAVALPEGRHWIRLTANDENHYLASVSTVSEGPASFSRSGLGNDFFGMPPIALRIVNAATPTAVGPTSPRASLLLRVVSPNPFTRTARLTLTLAHEGPGSLAIYDVRGRLVRTLLRGALPAGRHEVRWDGLDDGGAAVAPGVYVAGLSTDEGRRTVKILRLK
jgi:hypothetical protein